MRLSPSLLSALVLSVAALSSTNAHADAVGTTVTGGLYFIDHDGPNNGYGDTPAIIRTENSFSGTTAVSTAVIGNGPEFTLLDTFGCCTTVTAFQADFTGTTLSIYSYAANFIDHEFVFTDPTFYGITYLGTDPDVHTSINGDTITIDILSPPEHYKTNDLGVPEFFAIQTSPTVDPPPPPSPSPVPEPSSLALLSTGVLAAAGTARRKFTGA
jgi:hypothetical protein